MPRQADSFTQTSLISLKKKNSVTSYAERGRNPKYIHDVAESAVRGTYQHFSTLLFVPRLHVPTPLTLPRWHDEASLRLQTCTVCILATLSVGAGVRPACLGHRASAASLLHKKVILSPPPSLFCDAPPLDIPLGNSAALTCSPPLPCCFVACGEYVPERDTSVLAVGLAAVFPDWPHNQAHLHITSAEHITFF